MRRRYRNRQRALEPNCDRHILEPKYVEDADRVARRLRSRAVTVRAADGDDLGIRLGRDRDDHQRVVDPDIRIEEDLPPRHGCAHLPGSGLGPRLEVGLDMLSPIADVDVARGVGSVGDPQLSEDIPVANILGSGHDRLGEVRRNE